MSKAVSLLKRYYLLITALLLVCYAPLYAQRKAFEHLNSLEWLPLTKEESRIYNHFRDDDKVEDVKFIRINYKALRDGEMSFEYKGQATRVKRRSEQSHGNTDDHSWFGTMPDQSGIFFTVINQQVASKFYMGDDACSIVPYRGDVHLLITYRAGANQGMCGLKPGPRKPSSKIQLDQELSSPQPKGADDNCTLRVLWVVTTEAETDIPMNLELAARMLQDEANLAYEQSEITTRLEIARVVRANFTETALMSNDINIYGDVYRVPLDLQHLINGTGAFASALAMRELYKADIVALVKHESNLGILYGSAYGVPVDPYALNAAYAFMVHSTDALISQRFVFSHEIGHIQGARHDDHTANPTYARGHKFSNTSSNNRTIMRTEADGDDRVQYFSNPDVLYNGIPVGTAERNNARRINETANQTHNFRVTSSNLLLSHETFDNEILARHLATQTISTDNKTIIASSGSRVSMRAGTSVTLLPGFHAQLGSEFAAFTNTCSYVPTARVARQPASEAAIIKEHEEFNYEAYPNPTSGSFTVAHPAATSRTIKVYDSVGKLVLHTVSGENSTVIDISRFPSGIYVVCVDNKTLRILKK